MKKLVVFIIIVALLTLTYNLFLFPVDETKKAVVKQFGDIVKIAKEPGLHAKLPFIQNVVYLEDRLLSYDIEPRNLITEDKKRLKVNNYAIWKIDNPKQFIQSMSGRRVIAQSRIDDVVYSNLRNELAENTFNDIVSEKRIAYLNQVTEKSQEQLENYGIKLIDVKIKRADLPEANEDAVYERMSSEREQKAQEIRANGRKEAEVIKAEADKESKIIVAEAEREAQNLRGEGDAEALRIYNDAYSADPEFYQFWRTLKSYEKSIDKETTIILSDELDYLKYLDPETVK